MSTNAELYEQDFYLWCLDTCATLGAREFEALDVPHLIEEIRALAGRDRRERREIARLLEQSPSRQRFVPDNISTGYPRCPRGRQRCNRPAARHVAGDLSLDSEGDAG